MEEADPKQRKKERIRRELKGLGLPPDVTIGRKFTLKLKLGKDEYASEVSWRDVANAAKRDKKQKKKRKREKSPQDGEPPNKRLKLVVKRTVRKPQPAEEESNPGSAVEDLEDDNNRLNEEDGSPFGQEPVYGGDTEDEEPFDREGPGEYNDYGIMEALDDSKLPEELGTLTARQRAIRQSVPGERKPLFEYGIDDSLKRQVTANEIRKREIMAKRRKEKLQEQMEEERQQVVEQLLNPKSAKIRGGGGQVQEKANGDTSATTNITPRTARGRPRQATGALDRVVYSTSGTKLHFSGERDRYHPLPLFFAVKQTQESDQTKNRDKKKEACAAEGCYNPMRYSHSKLGLPVCSLPCYRKLSKT